MAKMHPHARWSWTSTGGSKARPTGVRGFGGFASDVTDYVAADGSNNVAVSADIHDMARRAGDDDLAAAARPRPTRSGTA